MTLLFYTPFYLIIVDDNCLIGETRLSALISDLVPLLLMRHATSLVVVLLCLLSTKSLA